MLRKSILSVVLLLLTLSLIATVFPPEIRIPGYPLLKGNKVDFFGQAKPPIYSYTKPSINNLLKVNTETSVDFETMQIVLKTTYNNIELYPDIYMDFDSYLDKMLEHLLKDKITKNSISYIFQDDRQVDTGLIPEITIKIPKEAIPKQFRSILGDEQGKLNLDGSQRLTVTGTSTKRNTNIVYEGKDNSNFDLEMKQDLDLRLKGKIGQKISVDLKHNSNTDEQLFDPNNIHIEYDGDDDEIVQKIEAGNISLSLSGSKYVSTSISSQGLFGVKGELQVGDLKVQTIFSEEEGQKNKQKYTGNSQQDSTVIYSKSYANRTHYFVEPMSELFALYTQADADSGNCPPGWVDNAIKTNGYGEWLLRLSAENLLPKPGTMKVYLDDGNASNDELEFAVPGDQILDENQIAYTPMYNEQAEGLDYYIDYDLGLIVFQKSINKIYTIGIAYENMLDELQPTNFDETSDTLHVKVIRIRNQSYTDDPLDEYSKWTYLGMNIYDLGINNIKSDGFSLKVYTINEDNTLNYYVPDFVEDNGRDSYIDYLRLDSNGDGLINGDDKTIDLSGGYIYYPYIRPFYPLGDSLIYEDDQESIGSEDYNIRMSVKGSISRDRINLNQINILEGSVTVKVNGSTLSEGIDFIVDYDMGEISFLNSKAKDPNAEIDIEYEFRSGFSIERKTMAGMRADLAIGDVGNIGSTFVFKSEKVTDEHPSIGNENYNMFLGDIDANIKFKPEFMTRMVDFLPLIKTTTESEISLSGEVAFSFIDVYGNSKTKAKEAYIDDMESILNPYPLGVSRAVWNPASKPEGVTSSTGMINWFKQQNVRARDVYDPDTLTDEEENDEINVMAIKIIPQETATRSWGGLMKYIGNELDFSEMKYIQVLLKPENYEPSSPINVTMHIDLGDINENFYTFNEIDGVPELNTEDGANDGTSDGDLEVREDVGLDGIPDGALDDDPNDYFSSIEDHFEFPFINGTEENGVLDTEDLDGNGQLNTLDRYFEYTVDDITNDTDLEYLENDNQGWKLFRIPMTEFNSIVAQTVDPDLSKVKYARIWFEVDETTKINLVEFEVIGNKYSERPIYEVTKPYGDDIEVYYPVDPQTLIVDEESILLGISDNQKDSHYTSPKGTYEVVKGTQTLEQSLRIDVNNLQPNHLGLVRYKESQSSNWLSYGKLRFWVYPEQSQENAYNDPIDIVLRAGADSLNYYEIRYKMLPIPYKTKMESSDWKEIEVDFSKLTETKLNEDSPDSPDTPDTLFVTEGQFTYVRYRNPTLSAMQELSMGLMIPTDQDGFNGTIYFDDIRVADPFNDMGYAYSVDLRTKFADFIDFSIGYEQKTEDFRKEILRNTALSYVNRTSFDMTGKINLHKFTPYSWGYNIPLNLSRNQSWGIPRYKANSDILRKDLTEIYLDKEENNSKQYSAEISFSKNASKPHWWTKYTLDATTISARVTYNESTTPTTVDTTMSYNGTYTYNLSIPREKIGLKLFKNYYWYFIPRSYDNSFTLTADDPKRFNWDTNQKEFLPALNTRDTKTVTTNNSINYDIFSDLSSSYRLTTKRDLVLKKYYKDVNIGNETEYKQTIDVNYDPNFFPNVFSLSVSPQTVFNETKRLLNGNAVFNGEEYDFQRTGSVSRVTNVDFTFKNSDMFTSLSRKWKSKPKKSDNSGKAEDGKKEDLPNKTINTDEKNSSSMPKEEGEKSRSETKNELQELVDAGKLTKDEMYDKLANVKEEETKKTFNNPKPKGNSNRGGDSKDDRGSSEPNNVFTYFSKLKNIVVGFDNNYSTNYGDLQSRPEFLYQLGIPDVVESDALDSIKNKNSISFNSGIDFTRNINLSVGYSYSLETTEANSSSQREDVTFPDIGINVSEFQKWFGIEKILTSSRLSSNYSYSVKKSGDLDWIEPNTVTKETSLSPLINWNGNWLRNINTTASYSFANVETVTDRGAFDSTSNRDTNTINGSVSYSFTAARGLKLPFIKKRMRLKNELTSSLSFNYVIEKEENKSEETTIIVNDKTRLSITPTVLYNFSKNIKGGFDFQYSNDANHKTDESLRTISTALWVEIKF